MQGIIDRRILVNFQVDPDAVRKILPAPFRPKLYKNTAIAGICLIRLTHMKARGLPFLPGFTSENGAHRIAVEWEEAGETRQGVYIPRRDTSLWLNTLVGGRLFPGKHFRAKFNVQETGDNYHIEFLSADGTGISIDARRSLDFDPRSIFGTLQNASDFFQAGELGYSPNRKTLEGLRLKTRAWHVQPMEVTNVRSSFFEDVAVFPPGSARFDNALLMRNIEHEWQAEERPLTAAR